MFNQLKKREVMVDKENLKKDFKVLSVEVLKHYDLIASIRRQSIKIIMELLSDAENNTIEISEENMISVPYDGGNHPEYASNCFSNVNSVYLENDVIYLDIDDCDEYEIDRVNSEDVFNIAEVLVDQTI